MSGTEDGQDLVAGRPAFARRTTYGRRQGRPLRAGQKALLGELLPRLQVVLPEPGGLLNPKELFDQGPRELWLEIGFGAGEHLAWQAARNHDVGIIGAEVFIDGIVGLLRQVERERLDNVRIYQGDGRDLLDALPEASLARCFLLFPDPWPKRRHHKRRLVQAETLDRFATVVADNGELRIATDHPEYLRWMLERVPRHPDFEWLARRPRDWRERPDDWPVSRYEMKALGEGRPPSFLRFRRRPRPEP